MAIDSRGIEYDPFLPSVMCADGSVFQVVIGSGDERTVDMAESARLADKHDNSIS